jgi:hypothetical protein
MKGERPVIELSDHSLQTLLNNRVSKLAIEAICRMTECIYLAADDVADSTGDDLYDDATGRGQLLYRRAHNRIIDEFKDDSEILVSTEDNALHVLVDGCALSFYSARNGLEQPALATTSRTKRGVVDEMQTQLLGEGLEPPEARRLVLMHDANEDGLLQAAVGVLRAGQEWAWSATTYDRTEPAKELPDTSREPSYEEQPEAKLPPIERRHAPSSRRNIDQHLGRE